METPIILAHFGGHGMAGVIGVALLFVVLTMVLLVCLESKNGNK